MAKIVLGPLFCAFVATFGLARSEDPFVGKWKLNTSRSQIVDQMSVEPAGPNKYRFIFDGTNSETITVDGTDQPGLTDTTLSVTVDDPHTWTVMRKKDGRTLLVATWTLSADGRTLHDNFKTIQSNGSALTVDYVYDRTAGTSGFPGTWESTTQQLDFVYELQIQPFEGAGLSLITPATRKDVTFDGKDHPSSGAAQGTTCAGRRVSERAVDLTDKTNSKTVDTEELRLSEDGKVLTMTIRQAGRSKPTVLVLDRELSES